MTIKSRTLEKKKKKKVVEIIDNFLSAVCG